VLELTARFDGVQADVDGRAGDRRRRTARRLGRHHAGAARRAAGGARGARLPPAPARRLRCRSWSYRDADGTLLGQKVTPLDRVGIYVPGGKAAYPSSVLMNAIPAQVAGVGEIIMVVPTPPRGERNALVLAAAHVAGVHRVFTIGGAQAVAALAYGTATVPRWTRSPAPAMPMWPAPSGVCSARSAST
jgi:histidinol dehydrogenase